MSWMDVMNACHEWIIDDDSDNDDADDDDEHDDDDDADDSEELMTEGTMVAT